MHATHRNRNYWPLLIALGFVLVVVVFRITGNDWLRALGRAIHGG